MNDIVEELVEWDCLVEAKASLGECPIWSPSANALFWIDVWGKTLNRTSSDGRLTETWAVPDTIGAYALHADGTSALLALSTGLYSIDLATGGLELFAPAPYDPSEFQLNDGRCDRQGRLWIGSMPVHEDEAEIPVGGSAYWRVDSGGITKEIDGTTVANSIAFSPDGTVMYLSDRPTWSIWAFDYDISTGEPRNRRVFATVPEGMTPDGACVDDEGGYWIALFTGGRILRFAPDGTLTRQLRAPVSVPTMVCFGGENLDTMYVTTSRHYLDAQGLEREPLAGSIFRSRVGARGVPEPFVSPSLTIPSRNT